MAVAENLDSKRSHTLRAALDNPVARAMRLLG
jgi:hypothetical protein